MKQYWAVWANEDNIEGRGRNIMISAWATKTLAIDASKGVGPMGTSDGDVRPLYILECPEDEQKFALQVLKDHLLSKMTENERKILGLE